MAGSPATIDLLFFSVLLGASFFADHGLSFPVDVGCRTTGDIARDGVIDTDSADWSTLSVCPFFEVDHGLSLPRNRAGFGDADRGRGAGLSDVFSNILTQPSLPL